MLVDHSLVVVTGDGGKTLWQQVIVREARTDFNDFALLAKVVNRLDQQQLNSAVLATWQASEVGAVAFSLFRFCTRLDRSRENLSCSLIEMVELIYYGVEY